MREWVFKAEKESEGKTVEQILRASGFSKKEISRQKFLPAGITLDGKQCRTTQVLHQGQCLVLRMSDSFEEKDEIKKEAGLPPLTICYEDEDLLIADKPPGLACHRGRGHYNDNLGNQVQVYCEQKGEPCLVRQIGRLDRDTSGLVVFAKNQPTASRLWKQREQGEMKKIYTALVYGDLNPKSGTIDLPMGKVPGEKNKMQTTEGGMRAVTNYRVLEKKVLCDASEAALVECCLETGRTHQIRVHMASAGHPLLGDRLYGYSSDTGGERLCLHAGFLRLYQPFSGKIIEIKTEPRFNVKFR